MRAKLIGQRPVCVDVQIVDVGPMHVHLAAAALGAGFEAGLHAGLELCQGMFVRRAHVEVTRRAVGHDVGRLAALGDDAVNALSRTDVLAQVGNRLISEQQAVQCVETLVRHGRSMCRATVVDHLHFRHADARHAGQIDAGGVNHHGRVHPFECARPCHQFLAAAFLLGGCAQQAHAAGQCVGNRMQAKCRTQRRRGDDVVTAGMTDTR